MYHNNEGVPNTTNFAYRRYLQSLMFYGVCDINCILFLKEKDGVLLSVQVCLNLLYKIP